MLKKLGRFLRKLFKTVAVLAAVGLLVVVLFVASLWVEHTLSVQLTKTGHPYRLPLWSSSMRIGSPTSADAPAL